MELCSEHACDRFQRRIDSSQCSHSTKTLKICALAPFGAPFHVSDSASFSHQLSFIIVELDNQDESSTGEGKLAFLEVCLAMHHVAQVRSALAGDQPLFENGHGTHSCSRLHEFFL